jgi:hypothetical protein
MVKIINASTVAYIVSPSYTTEYQIFVFKIINEKTFSLQTMGSTTIRYK